jgi:hypothetical protein
MGLKFRRGTTAQKSGSLAFGEPYVNTDLGTLQIGGATGDITLGASGTGSAAQFSTISGSGLRISGNAQIDGNLTLGGNITIGDNTADSVNVVASLSSSLIPSLNNTFDLGSPTKQWRDLYLSSASLYINGTQVLSTNATELLFTTDTGQSIKFNELGTDNIILQTVDGDIELKSSGGGDVLLDPTTGIISVKGNVSMQDGTAKFLSSGGNTIHFGNNVAITGSLTTTGDVNIGGNITIGDNTTDTLNVVAALSSSLIPSITNAFDLGSSTKFWRDLYISTGSIKFVGAAGTVVGTLSNTGNGLALDGGVVANGNSSFGTSSAAVTSVTGSLNVSGSISLIGALSASTITGIGNVSLYSTSVDSRLVTVEAVSASVKAVTDTFATSASVASATATSITSLSSSVKAVTDTFATSASVASATATSISTLSGSVKTVTDAISGRVTTLEGTDISITLTGDVTGTGTITNLANVSFETTIAANSVALGTDTTGNYVASLVEGTGVTITNNSGENTTPTIAIGQAVATSSNVQFNSLGVGMAASATAGRIDASGDVVAFSSSDRNFKENITPIENPIEKIKMISGNTYDWKADLKDVHGYEGNDVGVIAQEIEEVLPQIVTTRENGYKAVKYEKLVALLIEGIKEQQIQIEKLRMDLDNYECKCDNCKSK